MAFSYKTFSSKDNIRQQQFNENLNTGIDHSRQKIKVHVTLTFVKFCPLMINDTLFFFMDHTHIRYSAIFYCIVSNLQLA